MKLQQVQLTRGKEKQIVWVDNINRLRVNKRIRLKDETVFWTIEKIFESVVEKEDIKHGWKLGGLE